MNDRNDTPRRWHAGSTMLESYASLTLDTARSASVEQHLLACDECRAALATIARTDTDAAELDDLWLDVIDAVDRPRPKLIPRVLHSLRISDRAVAVVAATPALRLSWLVAIAVALTFAVLNATRPDGSDALLLIIAPLIPLAGVGTAYGAGIDPLYEVARATPLPGSRIFLYRSLAVLCTTIPLTLVASFVLGVNGVVAVSWLLPALGLVGMTMALSTWVSPRVAAALAGIGWLAVLTVGWMRHLPGARLDLSDTFAFRPSGQVVFAVLATAGAIVFAARLDRIDQPTIQRVEAL